ncbi:hypothetical protein [Paenibacillus validus]|uniref:hypothetical protein n=1 Tax=Paenibacillus validus TaxID=44253 RepID=UPI003D2D0809
MNVLSDTKRLKARMNDLQAKLLFDRVIKPYKQTTDHNYYYKVEDKRNGVFLGHLPRATYMNFTTSLSFHSYSDDSPLLKAIFAVVPLEQWFASEIHIAFDFDQPYNQFHAVRPAKRADPEWRPSSLYLGGASSSTRLYMYDKQLQMMEKRHVQSDTWTRVELRCSFSPMKRISALTVEDFAAADQYMVFPDISLLPERIKCIVEQLNQNVLEWSEVHWKMKKKIREYATDQGLNLRSALLSNMGDIGAFIYSPSTEPLVISMS